MKDLALWYQSDQNNGAPEVVVHSVTQKQGVQIGRVIPGAWTIVIDQENKQFWAERYPDRKHTYYRLEPASKGCMPPYY